MGIQLTVQDLTKRWEVTPKTLQNWRWNGKGPEYFKVGRTIKYRLEDIESFETAKLRSSTSVC